MTEREEINMLRRLVADLTERVRTLEAKPAAPVYVPLGPGVPQPYVPPAVPWTAPYTAPWFHVGPATCGDPVSMRPITTCVSRQDGGTSWLAQARGEA